MIDNTKVPINTPEVSGEKNPARMKQQDILVGCTTDSCSHQSESVLGWELEEKTPQEMDKSPSALQPQPEEGEIVDKGIEALDVDSLLDRFLEYEQSQSTGSSSSGSSPKGFEDGCGQNTAPLMMIEIHDDSNRTVSTCTDSMVRDSRHDHTYASSPERGRCQNGMSCESNRKIIKTHATVSSNKTATIGKGPFQSSKFGSLECNNTNCQSIASEPFSKSFLEMQSNRKHIGANARVNCNSKHSYSGESDSLNKSKFHNNNDSDAENQYAALRMNNQCKRKIDLHSGREKCEEVDEFGRNLSLAKYDRARESYKRARRDCRYSGSEDESERFDEREYKRRQVNGSSRCDSDDDYSSDGNEKHYTSSKHHSPDNKKRKRHYNIEQERKLNFKFDCHVKDSAQEERRVVYIGRISKGTTQRQVWKRFREFGPIEKVTVHFRDEGDNYAFVTFYESAAAVDAIESGKTDKELDICFGGRRKYCGGSYVDFDSNTSYLEEQEYEGGRTPRASNDALDFDSLLNMCLKSSRRR